MDSNSNSPAYLVTSSPELPDLNELFQQFSRVRFRPGWSQPAKDAMMRIQDKFEAYDSARYAYDEYKQGFEGAMRSLPTNRDLHTRQATSIHAHYDLHCRAAIAFDGLEQAFEAFKKTYEADEHLHHRIATHGFAVRDQCKALKRNYQWVKSFSPRLADLHQREPPAEVQAMSQPPPPSFFGLPTAVLQPYTIDGVFGPPSQAARLGPPLPGTRSRDTWGRREF